MASQFAGFISTVPESNMTDSPASVPSTTRSERLKESLENAELLAAFAARNALTPNDLEENELDALILSIAKARTSFDSGGLDDVTEAKLLSDLRHLATAFLPVTAASIRDSSEGIGAGRRYFFWGGPISYAAAAVRRFAICSFVALLMLLAAQIVWLAGYDVVNRWRALEKEDAVAQAALKSAGVSSSPTATPASDSDEFRNLDLERNRRIQKEALMHLLTRWWNRFGIDLEGKPSPTPSPSSTQTAVTSTMVLSPAPTAAAASSVVPMTAADGSPPAVAPTTTGSDPAGSPPSDENLETGLQKNIRTLVAVETEVNIIQTYVLPLLYGLLGSCAYVLRQLTLETRARTFRRELGIAYWLHIFLGVLAGLAIGWFLRPEAASDGLIRGLTPFALSFLAGYSVEVLFAAMDRLVAAFGPTPPNT